MDKNTVFITGYAKLPEGITAKEMYKVICIGLLLDSSTGRIVDADCTLATATARAMVKDILAEKNINHIDEIIQEIEARYWGHAKKAVIAATKMCSERFYAYKVNMSEIIS